jgi:hypothetical protein
MAIDKAREMSAAALAANKELADLRDKLLKLEQSDGISRRDTTRAEAAGTYPGRHALSARVPIESHIATSLAPDMTRNTPNVQPLTSQKAWQRSRARVTTPCLLQTPAAAISTRAT